MAKKLKPSVKKQGTKLRKLFTPATNQRRLKTSRQQLANLKRLQEISREPANTNLNERAVINEFLKEKNQDQFRSFERNIRLSPSVRFELERVRNIQNKGRRDDDRMQRQVRERHILQKTMDLTKSHYNLRPVRMDFTGVSENNILKADNVFREDPENNILRNKGRANILDTKSEGNNLFF